MRGVVDNSLLLEVNIYLHAQVKVKKNILKKGNGEPKT